MDTLKQAFLGNKEVFKGLYLEKNWDWSIQYPIIHIDIALEHYLNYEQFKYKINYLLNEQFEDHSLKNDDMEISSKFSSLIKALAKYKSGLTLFEVV